MPYHEAIRDFLRTEESEVWKWYASQRVREELADSARFELLKSTYRLARETHPAVYQAAEEAASRLGLGPDVPLTIYQAQNPQGLNASLVYVPGELHLVLHGPLAQRLTADELRALFGHELTHYVLWRGWDGEYRIVDQILAALTLDGRAEPPHFATARLFSLYNEILCDRGSLVVVDDPLVVVSMLVKVFTDLNDVDPASYLRQAEEIYSRKSTGSDGDSHPEGFLRARAVRLWHEGQADVDQLLADMIEGPLAIESLDLLGQRRVAALTRRLVDLFLEPTWLRTDTVLGHARMFFPDYEPAPAGHRDDELAGELERVAGNLRDYFCYVLLDLVTVDRDLEEAPLAAALVLAETLGLKAPFSELAIRELRLRKRQFAKLDEGKRELLSRAALEGQQP